MMSLGFIFIIGGAILLILLILGLVLVFVNKDK